MGTMSRLSEKDLDELDMEFFLETEGIPFRLGRGVSGMQLNIRSCPSCGDDRWRTYMGLESGRGNCLAGDTEILTREHGAVPIEHVSGQTVTLLDGNGDWAPCVIHDHGIQETFEYAFEGMRSSTIIRSTAGHGWVDETGAVVLTKDMRPGQTKIADLRHDRVVRDETEYENGVIHGLIYGDGSKGLAGTFRLRLCSHHDSLMRFLRRFGFTRPDHAGGDPVFHIPRRMAWCEFKELPANPGRSLDYLLGFLRGWFAADGCVSNQPEATICVGPDEVSWLRQWGPLVGWAFNGATRLTGRTNYGDRLKESHNLRLRTQAMIAEDFLIEQHRTRWMVDAKPRRWTPQRVWVKRERKRATVARRMERVYCPYVSTTNSFALACGIHSRNCFVCGRGFNKRSFIHAYLGEPAWRQTFEKIEETLKHQGWRPKRKAVVAVRTDTVTLPLSEPIPDGNGEVLPYLSQRGLTAEDAAYFGLRHCHFGWWRSRSDPDAAWDMQEFSNRIIIPVFDLDGSLVTFQGRDITGKSDRKYLFPKALPGTGRYLLNGHNFVAANEACMGEGFFDVAAIKMAFDTEPALRDVIPLGSFGKHLSYGDPQGNDQLGRFNTLKGRGLRRLTIMWDGEEKALVAALDAAKKLNRQGLRVRVALLPHEKDPNEILPEQVIAAYHAARPWTPALDMTWRLRNPYSTPALRTQHGV